MADVGEHGAPGPTKTSSPSSTPVPDARVRLDARPRADDRARRDEAERADDDVGPELRPVGDDARRVDPAAALRCARRRCMGRRHASVPAPCRASLRPGSMPLTYKQAGVDIDAGDELVERIKPLAAADAHRRGPRATSAASRASAACPADIEEPVLVSGTDGVGTKLKVAFATGVHDTIGFDLVGMCVNDVVTCGARPLFFLDYFAHRQARRRRRREGRRGHRRGVQGERAARSSAARRRSSPGCTPPGEYDLAGFAVGVVARKKIVDGTRVADGRRGHRRCRRAACTRTATRSRARSLLEAMKLALDARPPELGGADASARRCSRRRASTRAHVQARARPRASTCAR